MALAESCWRWMDDEVLDVIEGPPLLILDGEMIRATSSSFRLQQCG